LQQRRDIAIEIEPPQIGAVAAVRIGYPGEDCSFFRDRAQAILADDQRRSRVAEHAAELSCGETPVQRNQYRTEARAAVEERDELHPVRGENRNPIAAHDSLPAQQPGPLCGVGVERAVAVPRAARGLDQRHP
jgi:hypothetical protein